MIDLGWAAYGAEGKLSHRWEFDQRIGLLRSFCHAIYRRTDSCCDLFVDDNKVQCRNCLKKST